jgi:ATP-dependent helicase/nuclease subunit A
MANVLEGLNPQQLSAVTSEKPLTVIAAGAGSGKTRVLIARMIYVLEQFLHSISPMGTTLENITAVTFTEKATQEMKHRLQTFIRQQSDACSVDTPEYTFWKTELEKADYANISTIHSFCRRVIELFPLEAQVYPDFSVLDDKQATLMQYDVFQTALESFHHSIILQFYKITDLRSHVMDVYNNMREQGRGVHDLQTAAEQSIMNAYQALTNLEQKEEELLTKAREYAAVCLSKVGKNKGAKLAAQFHHFFTNNPNASYEEAQELLEEIRATKAKLEADAPYLHEFRIQHLLPFYKERNALSSPDQLDEVQQVVTDFLSLLQLFDNLYTKKKRISNSLDFTDLQLVTLQMLKSHDHVRAYLHDQIKHMMIDEFQDTNHLQMEIVQQIKPDYLFIVGDPKQAIYGFRGGDVRLINELGDKAKEDEAAAFIDMNTNYRTCDSIIIWVNQVFEAVMKKGEGDPDYKTSYAPLEGYRNKGEQAPNRVEQLLLPKEENEWEAIANRIVQFKQNEELSIQWGDMAILLRSRTGLQELEQVLTKKKIPFTVHGGIGFYEQQEVMEMLTFLQWINRPFEEVYLLSLLRGPLIGLTLEDICRLKQEAVQHEITLMEYLYKQKNLPKLNFLYEKYVPFYVEQNVKQTLTSLFHESGLAHAILLQRGSVQKVKNVEKLIDMLHQLGTHSLEKMLQNIVILKDLSDREGNADAEFEDENTVHIMTIHASKGLEFPVVFVPKCHRKSKSRAANIQYSENHGIAATYKKEEEKVCTPHYEAHKLLINDKEAEEAKRLFYVAATRARDYLILSGQEKPEKGSWFDMIAMAQKENPELTNWMTVTSVVTAIQEDMRSFQTFTMPDYHPERTIHTNVSVSEVTSYVKDKREFYMTHLLQLQSEENKIGADIALRAKSKTLGQIVHRFCELFDLGWTIPKAQEEAWRLIGKAEDPHLYYDAAIPLMERYTQIQHLLGKPLLNEWEFVYTVKDQISIIGTIDKVVERNGKKAIIDIKTNVTHNIEELIEYYKPQLYLYKWAYEQLRQESIDELYLLFLRDEETMLYEVPYEIAYEQFLYQQLQEMDGIIRSFLCR